MGQLKREAQATSSLSGQRGPRKDKIWYGRPDEILVNLSYNLRGVENDVLVGDSEGLKVAGALCGHVSVTAGGDASKHRSLAEGTRQTEALLS